MSTHLTEFQFVWQDRDLRFDIEPRFLACRNGETIIDSINAVEDTQGNNGQRGSLICTNLRMMWVHNTKTGVNLSIGYDTIVSLNIKKAISKLRGSTQALSCIANFKKTKYEFVFTSLVKNSPRLFTTVQTVLKAYETSRQYRDLKLRGSIMRDNELILLPNEEITNKVSGVWNLSADHGNLGTLYLTNIRVVWKADLAANFNASIPYTTVRYIKIRSQTKFGRALVFHTFSRMQGYVLGFRVDPGNSNPNHHR